VHETAEQAGIDWQRTAILENQFRLCCLAQEILILAPWPQCRRAGHFREKSRYLHQGKQSPRVFSALIPSEGQQIKTGIPTDKTGYNLIRKHKTLQESASAEKTGFSRFFYKFISDNL